MIGLLAMAAAMTLGDLQTICAEDQPIPACKLYILGVAQGASMEAGLAHDHTRFCLPDDVSDTELAEVVKRWTSKDLAAFPQDKNLEAAGFVGAALLTNYPCTK